MEKNCKECLHNPVCQMWRDQEGQDASSFQLSGCIHFEDRSRFVKMPCKIGDDIWWIDSESWTVECEKNGVTGFIIKKDEVLIRDSTGCEDRIGTQYCFLSKEAAEKALAEGGVADG